MKVITTLIVERDDEPRVGRKLGKGASVQSIVPIGKRGRYAVIINSDSLESEAKAIDVLRKKLPNTRITRQTVQYFSG
jgi:hypothetical protein